MIKNNFRLPFILSRKIGTKFFYIPLLSFFIGFSACDEASVVGLDVQPEGDLLNVKYTDTLTLITQSVKEDSLRTDESILLDEPLLFGKYIDPNFGVTSSSIYTSIKLSTSITNNSFGADPTIDSVILALVYDTAVYGKKDRKQQTVNVYQLTEMLEKDKIYASNNSLAKNSYTIASQNFIPKPFDSVIVSGKKEKPQLRIKLDKNFGQTLLNNQNTGNLANNSALQSFIKGLYITTENTNLTSPGDGNILKVKLSDALSKLTLYFHYTGKKITNPNVDSIIYKTYDFGFGGVARHTGFDHNYSGTNVDMALQNQIYSTLFKQNSTTYIQSMAGIKTKVEIPWIKKLNDSGAVSINKAELIIKVDPAYNLDTFAAPKSLIIFGINNDGSLYILPDAAENIAYYNHDGTYNKTTKEYRFNIARYTQQLLNGKKENNGFYILSKSGAINAHRVVIGGGAAGNYQMKLNITYTKLH